MADNGKSPFKIWINGFKDSVTSLRIQRRLRRVEQGNYGDYKYIDDGIYELKLNFGSGYRLYFIEEDDIFVVLLCAGNKSTQVRDIAAAKEYAKIWRKHS